jgi:hypothetical protein
LAHGEAKSEVKAGPRKEIVPAGYLCCQFQIVTKFQADSIGIQAPWTQRPLAKLTRTFGELSAIAFRKSTIDAGVVVRVGNWDILGPLVDTAMISESSLRQRG